MKNLSILFLRIIVSLGGLLVLAFIIFVSPELFEMLALYTPAWFSIPVLSVFYFSALPFYYVLFQTFMLLRFIDTGKAFSLRTVKSLKRIKYASLVAGTAFAGILPLLYFAAQSQDAPGILAIGIILTGTWIAVATLASVLQLVLQSAMKIEKENDLTV